MGSEKNVDYSPYACATSGSDETFVAGIASGRSEAGFLASFGF